MVKLSDDHRRIELMGPSLELIDQILEIMYMLDQGNTLNKQRRNKNFRDSIESFNDLYVKISERLVNDRQYLIQENVVEFNMDLDAFNKFNMIMLKILQF